VKHTVKSPNTSHNISLVFLQTLSPLSRRYAHIPRRHTLLLPQPGALQAVLCITIMNPQPHPQTKPTYWAVCFHYHCAGVHLPQHTQSLGPHDNDIPTDSAAVYRTADNARCPSSCIEITQYPQGTHLTSLAQSKAL
jgi:hypothetical protein